MMILFIISLFILRQSDQNKTVKMYISVPWQGEPVVRHITAWQGTMQ